MYTTILFDLGKVIVGFDFQKGFEAMQELSGVPAEAIRKRFAASGLASRFETGLIDSGQFWDEASALLGAPCDFPQFCRAWNAIFFPDPLIPAELVAGLKRNYRILLVSNTNAIHFEMLRSRYAILGLFDGFVLSYEIRAMKPAQEFYAVALSLANGPASTCLFIDDLAENVEGARLAGMDTIQFQSREQLERELESRGVSWRSA